MEIVHIVLGKANPERMNGVNKVVYQLATEQARNGHKVTVWGITKDVTVNFEKREFETRLFKARKTPFHLAKDLKYALDEKVQRVFHIHGGWVPTMWAISRQLKSSSNLIFLTPHGAYNVVAIQKSKLLKKLYFHLFEKKLLKNVKSVHCIGKSEQTGLKKLSPKSRSTLIPYGFYPNLKGGVENKSNEFVIGFVGRIDVHTKGLDLIVRSFSQFLEHGSGKLWIVGDGEQMSVLKELIRKYNVAEECILYGSKYGSEKNALLKKMNVFLHPSRNEGLPTAVLEAASFGIPAIVSEATNVGSYISDYNAGLVIENEDCNSLTRAIETTYMDWKKGNPIFTKENSLNMLKNSFSWPLLVKDFERMYFNYS